MNKDIVVSMVRVTYNPYMHSDDVSQKAHGLEQPMRADAFFLRQREDVCDNREIPENIPTGKDAKQCQGE
jgi:hypothetical protein